MEIAALSDLELTSSLDSLAQRERENTLELLRYLIEFDSRALYRELGYSSLFDYCTRRLKLSEASAYRRISAARCLRDNPELECLLLSGEVTLCSVSAAAKSIGKKVTSVAEIVGCSRKEVESIVAERSPVAVKPREVIKPLIIETAATLVEAPKREERVSMTFSVKREVYEKFKAVQAELSLQAGKELSVEAVFERVLSSAPLKRVVERIRVRSSASRYIPKAVKQAVYARDNGQCCYISPNGVRCEEKR